MAQETRSYAYYRSILRGRSMPCAYVDLDAFDQNVDEIADRSDGKPIRVATKSVRCVELLRRVLDRNSHYRGLMTYMPRETTYLAEQGFDDFLLGYPAVNVDDIASLVPHVRAGKTIRFMVDSTDHLSLLESVGAQNGVRLQACLDLDMSSQFPGIYFGVRRSPLTAPEQACLVAAHAATLPHVHLDALMGYEAQIAGLPDNVAGSGLKNALFRYLKKRSIAEIGRRRGAVVHALEHAGVALAVVNGGGTGSMESTCAEPWVTEVTVGSGFFAPVLFDSYTAFRHHPAVGYAIEITRRPAPGVFTCHGGGYVASGAVGPDKAPRPFLPVGAELLPMEGAGEVQTPIRYGGEETLQLGDPILMRYAKGGESSERFATILAISNGQIVGEYPTYRGDGQQFC